MKKTINLLLIICILISIVCCNNDKIITFGEYHNLSTDDEISIMSFVKFEASQEPLRNLTQVEFQKVYDYLLTLEIVESRTNKKDEYMITKPSNFLITLIVKGKENISLSIGDDFIFVDKSNESIDMVVHTISESSINALEVLLNELIVEPIAKDYGEIEDKLIVKQAIKMAIESDISQFNVNSGYKAIKSIIPRSLFYSIPDDFTYNNVNNYNYHELWEMAKEKNSFDELTISIYVGLADNYVNLSTYLKELLERKLDGLTFNLITQGHTGKLPDNYDSINVDLTGIIPSSLKPHNCYNDIWKESFYDKHPLLLEKINEIKNEQNLSQYIEKVNKYDEYLLTEIVKYIPLVESQKFLFSNGIENFDYNVRGDANIGYSFFGIRNLQLKNDSKLDFYLDSSFGCDLDISETISDQQAVLLNMIYEGLVNTNNGEILPGAAKSWTVSNDGLVYTFKIRENMSLSNGESITAKNYYDSWIDNLKTNFAILFFFNQLGIKNVNEYVDGKVDETELGIKLIDNYTLEITLASPNHEFLYLLNSVYLYPIKYDEIVKECNGPYILKPDESKDLVLVKNDNYWNKDEITIEEIRIIKGHLSDEEKYELFLDGELDFTILSNIENISGEEYQLIDGIMYCITFLD